MKEIEVFKKFKKKRQFYMFKEHSHIFFQNLRLLCQARIHKLQIDALRLFVNTLS